MDIAEFVTARLDEEEQVARAATPGRWFWADRDTSSFPQMDRSLMADAVPGEAWQRCDYFCRWSGEENLHRGEPGAPGHEHRITESVITGWGYDASGLDVDDVDAAHIAHHDPARVLADVAAKRAIVANALYGWSDDQGCSASWYALQAIAQVWSVHSDFDPAWRIELATA